MELLSTFKNKDKRIWKVGFGFQNIKKSVVQWLVRCSVGCLFAKCLMCTKMQYPRFLALGSIGHKITLHSSMLDQYSPVVQRDNDKLKYTAYIN